MQFARFRRSLRPWLAISMLALNCLGTLKAQAAAPRQLIAYVFADDSVLDPDLLTANDLTRINYAFADIRHGRLVEGSPEDSQNLALLRDLRQRNPSLKLLVSVGGWGGSGHFSDMALTRESRALFIDSVVAFLKQYDLDGLDVDWEYPGLAGAGNRFRPEDKENYTALLRELRARFNREEPVLHRRLLLSMAAGAESDFLAHTEMGKVQQYVDSVNLMAYDYYEPADDRTTGNQAPLYTDPRDPERISADRSVRAYESAGVPAGKLVLGVPFYGHVWSDVPPVNHGLFEPGKPSAHNFVNYSEISATLLGHGFVRWWDAAADAPTLYSASRKEFVSYDDAQSLTLKSDYVVQHDLAGIMFWDSEGDPSGALVGIMHQALQKHR